MSDSEKVGTKEKVPTKKPVCTGCKLLKTGSFQVNAGCPVHNKLLWTLPKPRRRKKK